MPDLATALAGLYSGGDVTIFQAVVDAVGVGVVTLHANGGQFTDVPYIQHGTLPGVAFPSIGDHVYVVGRQGWGMLVLGRAAPSDRLPPADNATHTYSPTAIGVWNTTTGTWSVPTSDVMAISPADPHKDAYYFFNLAGALPPTTTLASASFYLGTGPFDESGADVAVDNNYVDLTLFSSTSATPSAAPAFLTPLSSTQVSFKRWATSAQDGYVSIPLSFAQQLLSGSARGFALSTEDFPGVVYGPGTLRLTTL